MINRFKKILEYNIELFLLRNMTSVIVFILGIIWLLYCFGKIDLTYSLTSSGAIIAFWYGYKKYERDKELEVIEKYSNKYNNAKKIISIKEILNIWYEEFYLYKKGYISNKLWNEWKHWIIEDIGNFIDKDSSSKSYSNFVGEFTSYFRGYGVKYFINKGNNIGFHNFIREIMLDYLKRSRDIYKVSEKDKKYVKLKKKLYNYYNLSINHLALTPNDSTYDKEIPKSKQ